MLSHGLPLSNEQREIPGRRSTTERYWDHWVGLTIGVPPQQKGCAQLGQSALRNYWNLAPVLRDVKLNG